MNLTVIPPASNYYFNERKKAFLPKIFWSKRFQKMAILGIVILGVLGVEMSASSINTMPVGPNPYAEQSVYASYIKESNPNVAHEDAIKISSSVIKWAKEFSLDPNLLLGLAKVESSFNKHSISPMGALGITQVMVQYHIAKIKIARDTLPTPELFDIDTNIYLGAWVLRDCMKQFKIVDKALLCYNGSNASPNGYDKSVLKAKHDIEGYMKTKTLGA